MVVYLGLDYFISQIYFRLYMFIAMKECVTRGKFKVIYQV